MLDIEIGDRIALKETAKSTFQVRGYYKAQPFEPICCKFTKELLEKFEAEEKADGTYIHKIRIVPCPKNEAEYYATNHDWVNANDVVLVEKQAYGKSRTDTLVDGHEAHLKSFLADGENSVWGRVQLTLR